MGSALTLGQQTHEQFRLIMRRQTMPLGADDLPGPLTTSVVRPSGGSTGAQETDLLVMQISKAEWRAQRIDQLVRAIDALMRYRPHLGDVAWELCIRRGHVVRTPEGKLGPKPEHDPEAKADYADAAGVDVRTVDGWLQDAWEYLGVLWAEQQDLDWAMSHRYVFSCLSCNKPAFSPTPKPPSQCIHCGSSRVAGSPRNLIPLSDDDLLWALTTREELQQG